LVCAFTVCLFISEVISHLPTYTISHCMLVWWIRQTKGNGCSAPFNCSS